MLSFSFYKEKTVNYINNFYIVIFKISNIKYNNKIKINMIE